MHTVTDIAALQHWLGRYRRDELRVALVPTMGALHEGHLQLLRQAAEQADRVVVSVFVNPLQFGPAEDFQAYPRDLETDARLLEAHGTHLLFAPALHELIAPDRPSTFVEVPDLGEQLCGRQRPGHFRGVTTIVAKLFHLVQPQVAVFGEKDYQQWIILRRMVADLNFSVDMQAVPTARADDGLALSSRNAYLNAAERTRAPQLYASLRQAAADAAAGDDLAQVQVRTLKRLQAADMTPEYVEFREAEHLTSPRAEDRELVILAAARLGAARLIDNVRFTRRLKS